MGLLAFDNLYYQYKQGLLDEESWLTFREILKRRMINEEVTMHLATIERRLIAEVVNEILEEIELENSN